MSECQQKCWSCFVSYLEIYLVQGSVSTRSPKCQTTGWLFGILISLWYFHHQLVMAKSSTDYVLVKCLHQLVMSSTPIIILNIYIYIFQTLQQDKYSDSSQYTCQGHYPSRKRKTCRVRSFHMTMSSNHLWAAILAGSILSGLYLHQDFYWPWGVHRLGTTVCAPDCQHGSSHHTSNSFSYY